MLEIKLSLKYMYIKISRNYLFDFISTFHIRILLFRKTIMIKATFTSIHQAPFGERGIVNKKYISSVQGYTSLIENTLLKPKRHLLRCHGFVVHALLLRMHANVVYFRVMRKLCRREWNWLWNWRCVNQHSWDPWQWTTWSRRVTCNFNSV